MTILARQKGVVLVIVLWATVLLGILFGSMMLTTRTNIQLTQIQRNAAQARALAEGGVYYAILILLNTPDIGKLTASGGVGAYRFGPGTVSLKIQDEAGRIDLNRADNQLFDDLLASVGVGDDQRLGLIDKLQDWRDGDDQKRLQGAEKAQYEAMGLAYGPKDAPFEAVEEILQIPGMTRALYKRIRPALTVHSRRKEVNLEVAPPVVLKAVPGLDYQSFDQEQEEQAQELAPGELMPRLEQRYAGRSKGRVFSIAALGDVSGTKAQVSAAVTISRNPWRPFTILSWYSGANGS